jgi:PAS domain S-box-containing protein
VDNELGRVVDILPGLVWSALPDGCVDFLNRRWREYTGLDLGHPSDAEWRATIHPDDLPQWLERWRSMSTSDQPWELELRLRRFDGAYRWFLCRACSETDASGQITRWCGINTDIDDDRRRAENDLRTIETNFSAWVASLPGLMVTMSTAGQVELFSRIRASERNLALIINTIPALAWSASTDGRAEFFNQHYLNYVGLSADQAKDWGWTTAVHPDDLNGLATRWQRIMASEELGEAEARLRRHDGEYRWFLLRANPLRDESGNVVKWYGVNTDIEDRKRAETQLGQAYGRLAEAQRLSKTGSFVTDLLADRNWSDEAYRIFEFDPATKVTVQAVRDVVHVEDRPLFDAAIARAMAGMQVDYEFRIVTHRGTVKHVRTTAHIIEQAAGRPLFVGAVQDVTESKVAEEALNKARSELAHVARVTTVSALTASIAHEVNQPLSGIITNAGTCLRMLNADPPNLDGARETVRRTIRDGNRAADVIARLRALFSKREFTVETLDLTEATHEVIALSLSDLKRNRVILRSELVDDLPPVTGDRVQLQQVILNLLRNASDAMADVHDRPRQLLVKTEREAADRVRVTVRDVGVGLDRESLDKLFDAFYTTKSGGMGIGLSVSRSIIESHRGHIWAAPNDGPGATFAFSIPCEPTQPAGTTEGVRAVPAPRDDAHAMGVS